MSQLDRGRAAAEMTVAALGDVTDPRLYRRNAFRITGLPTDADRRTVRQRRRQMLPMLEAGVDVDLGHSLPVGLEDVRTAFGRLLENPHQRLVDELFWLWGTSNETCGCGGTLHRDHDAAVRAHSAAFDLAATGEDLTDQDNARQLWSAAGLLWGRVLRRAAFWDHVRARITALDERQLDESAVDVLRDRVPLALLKPLIDLAARSPEERSWLADQARSWPAVPQRVIDEQLEKAAAHLYGTADKAIDEATEALDRRQPEKAASVVYRRAMPELKRLDVLVPHRRHRSTMRIRDKVALVLNNCATALIDRLGPGAREKGRKWLATAGDLVSDPDLRATINANRETLDQVVRTFETIKSRVSQLVAAQRPDLARAMLLDLKRRLGGGGGTAEIDRLLATLEDRPAHRDPIGNFWPVDVFAARENAAEPVRTYRREPAGLYWSGDPLPDVLLAVVYALQWLWRSRLGKIVLVLLLVAVAVYFGLSRGGDTAALFSPRVTQNAPAGQCIASEDGWNGDKSEVPVVGCDQPHWGEVLGYPSLGATPSPYPGQDQTLALTKFDCGLLLAQQGLPPGQFTTIFAYPGQDSWNSGGKQDDNYATCVLHRIDNQLLTTKRWSDPARTSQDVSVPMNTYGWPISDNAPVGTCIESRPGDGAALINLPIVRCDRPHWAQVLGYPLLYQPDSVWPGDDAVYAAAESACERVADAKSLPPEYRFNVNWPAQDWWDGQKTIYAVCTASRTDDQTFSGGI